MEKKRDHFDIRKLEKNSRLDSQRTIGEKASDLMTKVMGSWTFIVFFLVLLMGWIALNTYYLVQYSIGNPFDPYPFILLNLVLSMLAAIQAPIILMSQNREAQKEKMKAEYNYAVNRKAEREIEKVKKQLDRIERKIK
jgi:uncharacterized membrane protein